MLALKLVVFTAIFEMFDRNCRRCGVLVLGFYLDPCSECSVMEMKFSFISSMY